MRAGPRKCLPLLVSLLAFMLVLPATSRAQSPSSCDANNLNVTIERTPAIAVAGQTVQYTVKIENQASVGGNTGCDVNDVTADFYCPGPTGSVDGPFGATFDVVTDVDYPAGGPLQTYGPYSCVMPNITGFAFAKVAGDGYLQDGSAAPGAPVVISKTISVQVQSCQVKVDKEVSCDGGTTWVDPGLVFTNGDGTNGCTALDGTAILVRYRVNNSGGATLYSCSLDDTNTMFGSVSVPTPLSTGTTTSYLQPASPPLCSDSFEAYEPDTATVNCFCTSDLDPDLKTSAYDAADVTCNSTPELSVTKLCEDENSDGEDEITIEVCAGAADLGLVGCTVTDMIYLSDPTCPADVGSGTAVTVSPTPFDLDPGTCQTVSGVVTVEEDACNTVSVTCTIETTSLQLTEDGDDVCEAPGQGCLTRTPGFWATHPDITEMFLPQTVCGVAIDNVLAGNGGSATEAMCSVGKDNKILGPQKTQLIRQCMAAYLNVTATEEGGGNCTSDLPSLGGVLDGCCDAVSACTDVAGAYTVNQCIGLLDSFNNSFDTLDPYGVFMQPGPANPKLCQGAKNNNVVIRP